MPRVPGVTINVPPVTVEQAPIRYRPVEGCERDVGLTSTAWTPISPSDSIPYDALLLTAPKSNPSEILVCVRDAGDDPPSNTPPYRNNYQIDPTSWLDLKDSDLAGSVVYGRMASGSGRVTAQGRALSQ